jgi:hypothetical protein
VTPLGKKTLIVAGLAAVVAGASLAAWGCSSNPVNVPVRTFERAQKVDVMCLRVLVEDPPGSGLLTKIPAEPVAQDNCAPVPVGVDSSTLPYHLYALVTQTSRGEVALVDLTSGSVVDEDRSTPGINFIPVGALPTDIAVAYDGAMAFVSSAQPNKPAIYGIPSQHILGDSQWPVPADFPASRLAPPTLPSLPACSLPQVPTALSIVKRDTATTGPAYEVMAVLAASASGGAKVVTIDPRPFLRAGSGDAGGVDGGDAGPAIDPGSLEPCPVTASVDLGDEKLLPAAFAAGAPWDDGVKYVAGGVDLRRTLPAAAASCASSGAPDGGVFEAGVSDAAADAASEAGDGGLPDGEMPFDFGPYDRPRPTSLALDDQRFVLYVADDSLPLIHVIDVSTPGAPRELAPLLATSLDEPTRKVSVGAIALSPATRDFKRFLYAVDAKQGSLLVYDVTAGIASARTPLVRPHPELNPFQPSDRLVFNAPVAAVSFVKHDWPLLTNNGAAISGKTGLLCNPNPNAQQDPTNATTIGQTDEALGAAYRPASGLVAVTLGAYRLRGVFGFVTLTNGQVVAIDVDDWDAPCRRPDPLGEDKFSFPAPDGGADGAATFDQIITQTSALAPPEPAATSSTDTDPYHAPNSDVAKKATVNNTSQEAFFPVSAPHRTRSGFFLRNDPQTGIHQPNLIGLPTLFLQNAAKPTTGADGLANPIMLPTFSTYADPSYIKNPTEPDPANRLLTLTSSAPVKDPWSPAFAIPGMNTTPGVRFAWEDPQVHIDQDWQVIYEGVLPGFDGISTTIAPTQGETPYFTLTLQAPNAQLCRRGVEDQALGNARVDAETAEMTQLGYPTYIDPHTWTGDYVQLADDILPQGDPYWSETNDNCWDESLKTADQRQNACQNAYGSLSDATPTPFRDFPILEAYDDRLVIGRFGYADPANPATVNRQIVGRDASNVSTMKLMRCCFHHQTTFKVRTGGRWIATGTSVGYLHHVTADAGGRCVQSCDPREVLLNARAGDVPRPDPKSSVAPDRNSPLAMRNPMFAFVMWSGAPPVATPQNQHPGHTTSQRDMTWKFSTRGQFLPLQLLLAANTTAIAPQSMRFIESLGQLAVVDGASQGLVLIDLNNVGLAHSPYF